MAIQGEVSRARQLLERGDTEAARPLLLQLAESDPSSIDARFWLGVCDQFEGDLGRAEEAFREVVSKNPKYAGGWYGLATVLESRGDDQAAEALFYRAASEGSQPARTRLKEMGVEVPPRKASVGQSPEPVCPHGVPEAGMALEQGTRSVQSEDITELPPKLKTLVPRGRRLVVEFVTLLLTVALITTSFVFVALLAAAVTDSLVDAEQVHLVFAALALTAIIAALRAIRRAEKLEIVGTTCDFAYRQETSGGGRGHIVYLVSFNLVMRETQGLRARIVPVEMRGRHLRGVLPEGEDVAVSGRVAKGNYLSADKATILRTGEVIEAHGATPMERLAQFVPLIPAILLLVILIVVILVAEST